MSAPIRSKLNARQVIRAMAAKHSLAKSSGKDINHQFQMSVENYATMGPKTRRRVNAYANSLGWRYFYSPDNNTHVWYDPKKIKSLIPKPE